MKCGGTTTPVTTEDYLDAIRAGQDYGAQCLMTGDDCP